MSTRCPNAPYSTYRLQLSRHLSFRDVAALTTYLHDLGVGAVYLSPIFRAVAGSTHGYDIVDHGQLDPTLGTDEDFASLAAELKARDMGLLLDVVPNHMGIDDPHNLWWRDVLQNGRCSSYARFFDIDWTPPKDGLHGKVLLAVLGNQFGKELEDQQLHLVYDEGQLAVRYFDRTFPTDPRSWATVLARVRAKLAADLEQFSAADADELSALIEAFETLPPSHYESPTAIELRLRLPATLFSRLANLTSESARIKSLLEQVLEELNGTPGNPQSFDALDEFLTEQPYRLCYWRVATDEINYRRFFDVDTLAAIRVEDPRVFDAVHAKTLQLVAQGGVTGLRIDHADGLRDPAQYLLSLIAAAHLPAPEGTAGKGDIEARMPYLVVEKILGLEEALPVDWPVQGTTGYDFLNLLNRLFVDLDGIKRVRDFYSRIVAEPEPFADVLYESKRAILAASLSSEVYVLSQQLARIAEHHRGSRDFTRPALHRALREVIACFPVYRTYFRPTDAVVRDTDRAVIAEAVRIAKRRNPGVNASFFDFVGSILTLELPEDLNESALAERREFLLKFQQITGPVTAKGLEDTACYRYYPLASLNEVGGNPVASPLWVEQFHEKMRERSEQWNQSMSATATHDTKRGEDVRARLNVLSEVPGEWESAVLRWRDLNAEARTEVDGGKAPDANEEYLIYQTLVGTWPIAAMNPSQREEYLGRITGYLQKALREGKLHTSWLSQNSPYEDAVTGFVTRILEDPEGVFVQDLINFVRSIADAGFVNSLAQLVIKIGAPGIPDFYQGCELWDFSLVDPDNRRPVDFERRRSRLSELDEVESRGPNAVASELLPHWPDDRFKLFVTSRGLRLRRSLPKVFEGDYIPLVVQGERAKHVCALARTDGQDWILFVVPRFASQACREAAATAAPPAEDGTWSSASWWHGTSILLPESAPRSWRHHLTGRKLTAQPGTDAVLVLDAGEVFESFPVAILQAESLAI